MISIIVPVYNSEKYLQSCVASIQNQTYKDIEIILIDDASTDSSGVICDNISGVDARVKVLHHTENKGLSESRYDGIMMASGKYIGFVDNDDFLAPWVYEVLIDNIGESQISCIGGMNATNEDFEDSCGSIINRPNCDIIKVSGYEVDKNYLRGKAGYGNISCTWGKLFRRDLIHQLLAETTKYREQLDWLFMEDLMVVPIAYVMAREVTLCKAIGYIHRSRTDSLGNNTNIYPYHVQTADAGAVVLQYFQENGYQELYNDELEPYLANLEGIWSRINRFGLSDRKEVELEPIRNAYNRYYKDFARLHKCSPYAITIFLFWRIHWLWELTVDTFYFKRKYR